MTIAAALVALLAAAAVALPHFRVETPQGIYQIHLLDSNPRRTETRNGATDPIYDRLKDQAIGYETQFETPFMWYSIITYMAITALAAQAAIPHTAKTLRAVKMPIAFIAVGCQIATMAAPPIIHAVERKSSTNSFSHSLPSGTVQTAVDSGLICTALLPLVAVTQSTFAPLRT